jgi:hypothetical protein
MFKWPCLRMIYSGYIEDWKIRGLAVGLCYILHYKTFNANRLPWHTPWWKREPRRWNQTDSSSYRCSPIGPFFLTESRSAAIEWAKKISNGLFSGDNPGVLFTYERQSWCLIYLWAQCGFAQRVQFRRGALWRVLQTMAEGSLDVTDITSSLCSKFSQFVKYNWFEAETAGSMHPDHTQYDVIRCLTSKGPRPGTRFVDCSKQIQKFLIHSYWTIHMWWWFCHGTNCPAYEKSDWAV